MSGPASEDGSTTEGPAPPGETRGTESGRSLAELVIHTVCILALLYSVYYMGWRWTETLNLGALWFSLPLVLAETWGVFTFAGLVFTTWKLQRHAPVDPPEGLSVAVFITTYDEPLPVIRKTAVAAREIRYPHETYILDDGCRDAVETLAGELGVRYIRRESSEHAKAGNLNNALRLTGEAFILQLDADHVPLPGILDRLLGYFRDEKVAFVQSPQDFYNLDSFTHVLDEGGRRLWEEQRIFFDVIQPGKDHWNSAFFCGSCGVIRRSSLDEIGGFSTETITEDVETSLLLHARGWKSIYVGESLAYGLSPGSAAAYQVQRLRWGQGSMQILRKFNPLTLPGLTLPQRLSYFFSLIHYGDGLQRLVFIAAPLVFFFTGVLPVETLDREFLVRFFPYLFLVLTAFELLARGHGYLWISERFAMAKWPIYVRALAGLFTSRRLAFEVTPKGDSGRPPLRVYLPQLVVLVAAPTALLWATLAHPRGWVDYGVPGWASAAFLMNAAWIAWNGYFAWEAVRQARGGRQEEDYRFRESVPVRFSLEGRTGVEAKPGLGMTQEIGAEGLRFLTTTRLEAREQVRLRLALSTGDCELQGRVIDRLEQQSAGLRFYDYGVVYGAVPFEALVAIELHCVHHAVPARTGQLLSRPDLFEDLRLWVRERRKEERVRVRLPAQIGVLEGGVHTLRWHPAVLEETSGGGFLLTCDRRIAEDAWIRVQIPGAMGETEGVVRHVTAVRTPRGARWSIGIERRPGLEGDRPRPRRPILASRRRARET